MNKYTWDFKQIRGYRDALKLLYEEASNDDQKYEIEVMIDMYNNMLTLAHRKNKNSFSSFDDILKGLSIMELVGEFSEFYCQNTLEIMNLLLGIYPIIADNYVVDDVDNLDVSANNQEIINITKDFFKEMTPNDVNKSFLEKLNSDDFYLNFYYSKKNTQYAGISIFDPIFDKKYINISRTNHLSDLIVLPHEMFHYLFNNSDMGIICDYNTYYLAEVEGLFANILFGEYFKENSNTNNLYFIKTYLSIFESEIEDLAIRNQLLDSLRNNKKVRLNKLNKFMTYFGKEPFNDTDEIISYLEVPQDVDIKYSLSYLAALDLYYIYQRDREFAFYLLKNIRYIKEDNDIINLLRRNHITFMDDDYENYKKYIKKLALEDKKYDNV